MENSQINIQISEIPSVEVRRIATQEILTAEAVTFLAELEALFGTRRMELLSARPARRKVIADAALASSPSPFLAESETIRRSEWKVAPEAAGLSDRRVEITGPAEAKMMINALNSGASVFMADLEDALSPTWSNVIAGQWALKQAVRRTLSFTSPEGKSYHLNERIATLVVRPRGLHLDEPRLRIGGRATSGSLFDFGLFFFHNAREQIARGLGPYFYLPKMESPAEAKFWNDVFVFAQTTLGIPQRTIRATVLVETLPAAFCMDEILFELRDHAAGLNAGRWDYLFSAIKTLITRNEVVFPDRHLLTMSVPFMRSYARLIVETCHRRSAHAIGGMSAFIPSRRDVDVNARALAKVREDKLREAGDGFDGTWVAHPDLVPIAKEIFDQKLGTHPHQKNVHGLSILPLSPIDQRELTASLLPDPQQPPLAGREVSSEGIRINISVALQYLGNWIGGLGAVAIDNLMEDAATAEIARAGLWQWVRSGVALPDGTRLTPLRFESELQAVMTSLKSSASVPHLDSAATLLSHLVLSEEFPEFLTSAAMPLLTEIESSVAATKASSGSERESLAGASI